MVFDKKSRSLTIGGPVSSQGVVGGAAGGPRETTAHPARWLESPRRGEAGRMAAGEVHRLCLHFALGPIKMIHRPECTCT
jgi:hypothetical protein